MSEPLKALEEATARLHTLRHEAEIGPVKIADKMRELFAEDLRAVLSALSSRDKQEGREGEIVKALRLDLEAMAHACSAPMRLWDKFSNRVLQAADLIESQSALIAELRAERDGATSLAAATKERCDHAEALWREADIRADVIEASNVQLKAENERLTDHLHRLHGPSHDELIAVTAERDRLAAMVETARGAAEELDERIQTALASQDQDVKVNGARHPGLLEPMRDILRDIIAPRATALRTALLALKDQA